MAAALSSARAPPRPGTDRRGALQLGGVGLGRLSPATTTSSRRGMVKWNDIGGDDDEARSQSRPPFGYWNTRSCLLCR